MPRSASRSSSASSPPSPRRSWGRRRRDAAGRRRTPFTRRHPMSRRTDSPERPCRSDPRHRRSTPAHRRDLRHVPALRQAPAELARATADGIRSIFKVTPRVTINETIVIEQSTPDPRGRDGLAADLWWTMQWSHSWLGSTKIDPRPRHLHRQGGVRSPGTVHDRRSRARPSRSTPGFPNRASFRCRWIPSSWSPTKTDGGTGSPKRTDRRR